MRRGLVLVAEGKLEFAGDLGPKLAQNIEAHILKDAKAYALCGGRDASLIIGMIGIAEHRGACRAEPFGGVKHATSILAVRYERMS